MWILPQSLISAFAQDTEALTSDSVELSQTCAQSLMRRSKPSPAKTYLREWKAGKLMRLRSGAISSPSLGQSFLAAWTSSLAVTHASHSAVRESGLEQKTQDTFGPTSQAAFDFCAPESASSRTSKDISVLDSEKSLATWKNLVTKRRGEYSQRLKLVRLTSESVSSSWPTATTRDWKDTGDMSQSMIRKDGKERMDTLGRVVQANHSTHGSHPESWATPRCSMAQDKQEDSGKHRLGEQAQNGTTGKLNPRWVETLMGLPVGWTMPSCASPVPIERTNYASLATELCPPPQH